MRGCVRELKGVWDLRVEKSGGRKSATFEKNKRAHGGREGRYSLRGRGGWETTMRWKELLARKK